MASLYKRRDAHRKIPCGNGGTDWRNAGADGSQEAPAAGEGQGVLSWSLQRRHDPVDSLISDACPQN